ncbi:hypothetical protein [Chryseobacterium taklimakanense]|uniref:Uncharacterized protein n=1 Tax=Chryseobacterium taklimakanense TaxID=536441 RepID=A0A3G8WLY7_9FLAO|nr:hypothetical protein [Chryseobacterium taklimakanense]AZI21493.1 hypothetical protein EIH08_12340 [Chryseobacterium taklimakanense]
MKKIFFIMISFLSVFLINSCREDGEWGNENGGQFGFTIERDATFIEKAVGETNQLKFNIKPSYDFASIATSFKFTTSLNGTLKLNGETLVANQEYTFTTKDNIFEYIGNVAGNHELKISVKNEKGASKEEDFTLPYSISDFSHTNVGGSGPIYQGMETVYVMKIVPGSGQPTTGYQIKFNTYDGQVKLNGVAATLGTWYNIVNIDNFTTSLQTNVAGGGKLNYSIKNNTITKDYEIQQNILPRTITIESMNYSPTNIAINTQMAFSGIINQSPVNPNTNIQYKTWISSASNSNVNGIQNTNNTYTNYTLGSNGGFLMNVNALVAGTYVYNIQVKDEFGNQSEVKTFEIKVTAPIYFDTAVTQEGNVHFSIPSPTGGWRVYQQNFSRKFKLIAGGSATITAVKYELNYDITTSTSSVHVTRTYNENLAPGATIFEKNNDIWQTTGDQVAFLSGANLGISNLTMKITGTANTGDIVSVTISPTASTN